MKKIRRLLEMLQLLFLLMRLVYLWGLTFYICWCVCGVKRKGFIILWWFFYLFFLWTFSLFDKSKVICSKDIVIPVDLQYVFLLWCLMLLRRHRIVLKLGELFGMLIYMFWLFCESCPWIVMFGLDIGNIEIDIKLVIGWFLIKGKMSVDGSWWKINLCYW